MTTGPGRSTLDRVLTAGHFALAVEIGEELRQVEGVRGLHIMAIGSTAIIPEVIERLGLHPRPTA